MLDLAVGINGGAALQAQLEALKKKATKEQLVKALKAGGEVFKEAIEERVPVRPDTPSGTALPPGAMQADIHVKVHEGTGTTPHVQVGPGPETALDMYRMEWGHSVGQRPSKKGRRKGGGMTDVPPHPVMRVAYESSRDVAMSAVIESLRKD